MGKTFIVFTLLFNLVLLGQVQDTTDKEFEEKYKYIALTLAGKDIDKSMYLADSLYSNSTNDFQKVKSLLLKAQLYSQKGNLLLSIETAHKAEEIVSHMDSYSLKSRVAGFLSTHYKYAGLVNEGETYWNKSLEFGKLVSDERESSTIQALLYQDKGQSYHDKRDYGTAIEYFTKSRKIIRKLQYDDPARKSYELGKNNFFLAISFDALNNKDSAKYYAINALDNFHQSGIDDVRYTSILKFWVAQFNEEPDNILVEKIKDVIEAGEKSESPLILGLGYGEMSRFHNSEENVSDSIDPVQKYMEILRSHNIALKENSNHKFITLNTEKEALSRSNKLILLGLGLITIIFIVIFSWYHRKKKRQIERFRKIMEETFPVEEADHGFGNQEMEEYAEIDEVEIYQRKIKKDLQEELIPLETEDKLLRKLERFERSGKFTDKNISLSMLASILNTNSKYLSYIISKSKNQNFNEYIQTLRINHLIRKMKEDSRYLEYKISYMAEECGFSSHSNFTVIFKKVTGMKPSVFINFLRKEKDLVKNDF